MKGTRNFTLGGLIWMMFLVVYAAPAQAQTTGFTYQGKLADGGNLASGSYDLQFKLFDTATVGTGAQQGSTLTLNAVAVAGGIFTVQLDFGAGVFPGAERFLEIAIKQAGGPTFTTLAPRQPMSSTPYAIRSLNSLAADGLSIACMNCITSSQIQSVQGSQITGPLAVSSIPAGSANYIQNTTSQQEPANFNISGTGTALNFNAIINYQLGGSAVLSNKGMNNLFAGINAGTANTTGSRNAFFGDGAGSANTTGSSNAFFGATAGRLNASGINNAFFGSNSGFSNTSGQSNSFFGSFAGNANTIGNTNTFIGSGAGELNTTGSDNTFIGSGAGHNNTNGQNTFVGSLTGYNNTTGVGNAFFGGLTGQSNTTGTGNTFVGNIAGRANTTASGNTFVGGSAGTNSTGGENTFVGSQAGLFNTSGNLNTFFGSAAGAGNTTASGNAFFGFKAGNANTICCNSFFGTNAGTLNTSGPFNSFFGYLAGAANTTGSNNSYFGSAAGGNGAQGSHNAFFGDSAGTLNTAGNNSFFGSQAGSQNTTGSLNSFFGYNAGSFNTTAANNSFFGQSAGFKNTTGHDNTFIGQSAGLNVTTASNNTLVGGLAGQSGNGANNTFVGYSAGGVNSGNGNTYIGYAAAGSVTASNATAIGANAFVSQNDSLVLGSVNGINGATADTNIGIGTNSPQFRLHVAGSGQIAALIETSSTQGSGLQFSNTSSGGHRWNLFSSGSNTPFGPGNFNVADQTTGKIGLILFPTPSGADLKVLGRLTLSAFEPGGNTALCYHSVTGILSQCSSSLRYKKDLQLFTGGLDLINRLRPIIFRWQSDNSLDLGFVAEEVAAVEPLLTTHNTQGQIEGVKYDRISAALVNAVKEQQRQIAAQQQQIDELKASRAENAALKAQIITILARLKPAQTRRLGRDKPAIGEPGKR